MSSSALNPQGDLAATSPGLASLKGSFLGGGGSAMSSGDSVNSASAVSDGDSVPQATSIAATTPQPTLTDVTPPEESLAQAVPLAVEQTAVAESLNPAHPVGGTAKEVREPTITLERPAVDQVPGLQYVEQEKSMELPPEVDSFIKKVEAHEEQIPHEVVIADNVAAHPTTSYLAQPVIVLPITPDLEKQGQSKSPQFSIRWLVEWSRKIMKMFSGKVVYREA